MASEKQREAASWSLRMRWQEPWFREKMTQREHSAQEREASAERMRASWKDPEFRAKMAARSRERLQDPGFRAKFHPQPGSKARPARVKGVCVYCGEPATTMDHVVPKSRGGSEDPSNKVPACRWCNTSKGRLTGDEFRAILERKDGSK